MLVPHQARVAFTVEASQHLIKEKGNLRSERREDTHEDRAAFLVAGVQGEDGLFLGVSKTRLLGRWRAVKKRLNQGWVHSGWGIWMASMIPQLELHLNA